MTELITIEKVPQIIKDAMMRDLSTLISNKSQLNGRCLEYAEGTTNIIYMLYLIQNNLGKIEEILFRSNDIIMDYRKPTKSQVVPEF